MIPSTFKPASFITLTTFGILLVSLSLSSVCGDEVPTPQPRLCQEGEFNYAESEVRLTTDSYPGQTSWGIKDSYDNYIIYSDEGHLLSTRTVQPAKTVGLCRGVEYSFIIKDAYGDGRFCTCEGGSYTIQFEGADFFSGGKFGTEEVKVFTLLMMAPTMVPTADPTSAPTADPTASLSTSPTAGPTASPTAGISTNPTAGPTASFTTGPTASPASSPTAGLSTSPTAGPTASLTTGPTASPTAGPTRSPTALATTSLTLVPTNSSTISPTTGPTTGPTAGPTTSPTTDPTRSPTALLTILPTVTPTNSPTISPTSGPTTSPTTDPTKSPTVLPTTSPTVAPTNSPTISPTSGPTDGPTARPTAGHTVDPTKSPKPTPAPTIKCVDNPKTKFEVKLNGKMETMDCALFASKKKKERKKLCKRKVESERQEQKHIRYLQGNLRQTWKGEMQAPEKIMTIHRKSLPIDQF